jgi:hypothetical protein
MTHLIGNKRKFNGKNYKAVRSFLTKTMARIYAQRKRNAGFLAVVTKEKMLKGHRGNASWEYYVWTRRK